MPIYIGLLRGINVGGKNMIKMAELKKTLEAMGLVQVQTYLQSGNVLFQADEESDSLRHRMEQEIGRVTGISPTVVLRTAEEFQAIIAACPYDADTLQEGHSIQISILTEIPPPQTAEMLAKGKSSNDEFEIHGRDIYYLFRQSVLDSKLASNIQKLGDTATTRNWNTISKLGAMAKARQE
ncbi:DUF1697 domain-containing protein [Paenibacillus sp. HWE-109]|uniref:DUF1697 domain-containing protein n=1 Tax=Paenibacillus sp. HWE-109 TaxID=1306526 RepID=UPI001EDDA3CE|nr:DUF1697 domain-containing protein [Paenibacillus sp. HWE-109]UKS25431.1 DUF1697 domain-containing protein [Paenibacillus sp. HWE-109]